MCECALFLEVVPPCPKMSWGTDINCINHEHHIKGKPLILLTTMICVVWKLLKKFFDQSSLSCLVVRYCHCSPELFAQVTHILIVPLFRKEDICRLWQKTYLILTPLNSFCVWQFPAGCIPVYKISLWKWTGSRKCLASQLFLSFCINWRSHLQDVQSNNSWSLKDLDQILKSVISAPKLLHSLS